MTRRVAGGPARAPPDAMVQPGGPERKRRPLISLSASMNKITMLGRPLALAASLLAGTAPVLAAQPLKPAGTGGVGALAYALRGLDQNKRVLLIAAHPDDENTELITFLSRGTGADVAYLSLSRGEGGQNLIGSQLGPALGLLRSEELLSSRSVDGAHQYFARAIDFGFSKTLAEGLRFWPRDSMVEDVVRVIRRFRPQVVVSIWSGTPRDGHGQHQVAGVVARAAFDALRDSTWGPRKFYVSARLDPAAPTASLATGALDPVSGRSYHQLAMAARSFNRSQEMGRLQDLGSSDTRLSLVEDLTGAGRDGFFAGVDTTLVPALARYQALIDSARTRLNPDDPGRIVPLLAAALTELRAHAPAAFRERKERALEEALADAAGVAADAFADDGRLVAGESFGVVAALWPSEGGATLDSVVLEAPAGWRADSGGTTPPVVERGFFSTERGGIATRHFRVTLPADAALSEPYFLRRPPVGDLYDWSATSDSVKGEPFAPPPLVAVLRTTIAGVPVRLRREVTDRFDDPISGEVREPLFVVPAVGVEVSPRAMVWPIASRAPRDVTVTLTDGERGSVTGELRLEVPAGWAAPPAQPFALAGEDTHQSYTFHLRPPAGAAPGPVVIRAVASAGGARYDRATIVVDYPHIRPVAYVREATLDVELADLVLPPLTSVGYIRGAADAVPEALEAVGVPIVLLTPADIEMGDLSRYDAIVVGSRAYETDAPWIASNDRLLEYARRGGRLIVQYQQYRYVQGGYAPYPLTIARPHDRVTDETAPVTELDPASALFHRPNAIGAADWAGWVQERGLYFAHTWAPAYHPLLEMGDNGEQLRGGLLVARVGRGLYVYTGLAFFRQLPANVPGAYRLFANLLALRPQDVR
jgi:LmbE family N-acetylglucosaminyl deacetylase